LDQQRSGEILGKEKTIKTINETTWKQLFKRALCIFFFCGHKPIKVVGQPCQVCSRCGETFWNVARVIHKHKRLRHNVYGKSFFKKQ